MEVLADRSGDRGEAVLGRGIGTEAVKLLRDFGFQREGADAIFGCDIANYNLASLRVFQKAGFEVDEVVERPPGSKSRLSTGLIITRERCRQLIASKA